MNANWKELTLHASAFGYDIGGFGRVDVKDQYQNSIDLGNFINSMLGIEADLNEWDENISTEHRDLNFVHINALGISDASGLVIMRAVMFEPETPDWSQFNKWRVRIVLHNFYKHELDVQAESLTEIVKILAAMTHTALICDGQAV